MRAEQDWFKRIIAACVPADEIPGRIYRRIKLRRAHQLHHVIASPSIGFGVGDAADAALWVLAELSQRREMVVETRAIGAWSSLSTRSEITESERRSGSAEADIELSAIHGRFIID